MSAIKNKIHIYSVDEFELKYCFGDEIPLNKLMNFSFSKKNKFISFLFDDLTIHIYSLSNTEKNKKSICKCKKDEEEKSVKSLFGSLISNIKVTYCLITYKTVLFDDKIQVFAKFKFYSDIAQEDYMERLKCIEHHNEVLMFYEKINEIVK